jgi:hypothetical protein
MSVHHRPVRNTRRPAGKPAHVVAAAAAASAPAVPLLAIADLPAEPVASVAETQAARTDTNPTVAPATTAPSSQEMQVRLHFDRLSALIGRAEEAADLLLQHFMQRVSRNVPVYPGELNHIFRGLHVLAKCGLELQRIAKLAGKGTTTPALTAERLDRLEARLSKLVAR